MLNARRTVLGLRGRGLHSSPNVLGSNKEWVAMKRAEKQKREEAWQRRRSQNPFGGNVGVARQLKRLDMDPHDPLLQNIDLDPDVAPEHQLSEWLERTAKFEKQVNTFKMRQAESRQATDHLRRVLTKKNFFPDPVAPQLLTWMEQETIRHLHKSDPGTWSVERLAEGFPAASPQTVKTVLSRRGFVHPDAILAHDRRVAENWKRLRSGELDIPDELREHFRAYADRQGEEKVEELLPAHEMHDVQEEIVREYKKKLEHPKLPAGEFGSIVADYKKKVAAKNKALKGDQSKEISAGTADVPIEMDQVFSARSEIHPHQNIPSPFLDTAVLNTSVELEKERRMTFDLFRKKHLPDTRDSFSRRLKTIPRSERTHANEHESAYVQWLRRESAKDLKIGRPEKLSADDVLQEEHTYGVDVRKVKKYQERQDADGATRDESVREPKKFTVRTGNKDIKKTVKIPKSKHKEGAIYRSKDGSVYDDSGEFLYRIPAANVRREE